MTKSSQNQQWILTAVRIAEIFLKKNSFNHGRYILQYGTKKLMIPRGEPSASSLHCRVMHTCIPGFQSHRTLEEHIFLERILCTQVKRSRGRKKVKAWVREINEELIYRECRNPPQQGREKQGRIAAPLESGQDTGEHKQPPPLWQTPLRRGNGGEHGGSSTRTVRSSTGASHHVQHGHIRQRLCMTRNM